ncbi:hypothetical protein [Paenibacillus thalictri]|uniref:DUF3862 domain-containing protein n=1 Tax=Paenibacillus thalictri TaxID=2527873 RepID=A0A4Q9DQM4_9BACL|nr:hypothetical protein [Paenibacillus thalictri]TBL77682.1 hypothetical protein EYB31_16165 [Paenibacillus thalictri]
MKGSSILDKKFRVSQILMVLLVLILAIVIGIVGMNMRASTTPALSPSEPNSYEQGVSLYEPLKEDRYGITKTQFDSIQYGMTYFQVKEILGDNGEVIPNDAMSISKTYIYPGKESGNAVLTFQDGKLKQKVEMGLS